MPALDDVERAAARRVDVLTEIAGSLQTRGYPPSISELASATGVSTRTIRLDLAALERDGKIARDAKVTRGIRVLVPVELDDLATD